MVSDNEYYHYLILGAHILFSSNSPVSVCFVFCISELILNCYSLSMHSIVNTNNKHGIILKTDFFLVFICLKKSIRYSVTFLYSVASTTMYKVDWDNNASDL
jgi:hypothetical protein